ncbi:hypothetical protein [Nocardia tenerifensis]|nr:hypothetical protein [Nocardia tenerifensis]
MQYGEQTATPIWAGEAADLIDHAADVVAKATEEADAAIGRTARRRVGNS